MPGGSSTLTLKPVPGALAQLVRGAGLGMRLAPGAVAHVERHGQDVVAVVEALLRAVPVVDVPVEDRDAVDPASAGVLGGQRDVVEEAVAVRPGRLGVVAGRADEGVGDLGVAGEDGLAGGQRRPGGGQRGVPRARGDRGRPREDAAACEAEVPDRLDVVSVVHEVELLRRGVPPIPAADVSGQCAPLEDRLHVAHPHRVLGVQLLLVEERRGRLLEEPAPGVVTQRVVVPEEIHHAEPVSGAARLEKTAICAAASVPRQITAASR